MTRDLERLLLFSPWPRFSTRSWKRVRFIYTKKEIVRIFRTWIILKKSSVNYENLEELERFHAILETCLIYLYEERDSTFFELR